MKSHSPRRSITYSALIYYTSNTSIPSNS